ncbi:MAG: hypothetical protein QF893_02330 [Alphaproteobacteria bacterium]|jgi:hypothetical protein|nr:hypothetical protein [Alphaproteobacteria bacterium]
MHRFPRYLTVGLVGLILSLGLAVASAAPATAGGYKHRGHGHHGFGYGYGHRYGHRRRHHGYRFRHHGYPHGHRSGVHFGYHGHGGGAVAGALAVLGGLLVLDVLSRPPAYAPPRYAPAAAEPLRLGNCKPTTGERIIDGRRALMHGTWCTDQYGRGHILNDSVRFAGFLD